MTESTYDYGLKCQALQDQAPGQDMLVTHWRGSEGVSRLYRFDITVALRAADPDLEKLLDQPASLQLRHPDGSTGCWHGIITQAAQHGHDDNYDYYQLILEPRMARLGLRQWTDIYLDQQLDDLIVTLLKEAQLTERHSGGDAPYDYRIAVAGQDLAQMRRPYTCQFEESCLHFLMRKLEFYGVYFWFEQGEERESVVFANDASQQPSDGGKAVYYPKGALDPDLRHVVLTRMDKHVSMRSATLSLRSLHDYDNTRVDLTSTTDVTPVAEGAGDAQSAADHFTVVDRDSGGSSNGVPGDTLAKWRAQEVACRSLQVQGEARTPGVRAGRFLAVSAFHRQAGDSQYYVFQVEHEGIQTLKSSPGSDEPSYLARFKALPRWRDQANQDDPVQFRPQRDTPVPRVSRLVTGFVDMDEKAGPQRYAQPDDKGRYKIRLTFARSNHGAYKNSAWLRQSTPYAAGAPQSDLQKAGMHFPLREGTEVLIAFLNEDPDLPVIVGSLPNTEAPSVVDQGNRREHVIRTPGGSGMSIVDGGAGSGEDESQISLSTPMTGAKLTLGTAAPENGFQLHTNATGDICAGERLLINVPGQYTLDTGADADKTVHQVFYGAKATEDLGAVSSVTVGASSFAWAGVRASSAFGYCLTMTCAGNKTIDLTNKLELCKNLSLTGSTRREKIMNALFMNGTSSTTAVKYSVKAYKDYKVDSPNIEIEAGDTCLYMTDELADLSSPEEVVLQGRHISATGAETVMINGGNGKLELDAGGAKLAASTGVSLDGGAAGVTIHGELIRLQ